MSIVDIALVLGPAALVTCAWFAVEEFLDRHGI